MNRLFTLAGIGAAIGAAAIAAGLSVALAHDDHDDHMNGQGMTTGTTMQMDPATMQDHMKQMLGEDAYQKMQDAMKQALGDDAYQRMLDRMATGCLPAGMGTTMPGSRTDSIDPGHAGHHPPTPAVSN